MFGKEEKEKLKQQENALITKILTVDRIKKIVIKHKLTKEQISQALPILSIMLEEESNKKLKHLTSFYVGSNGQILRTTIPSALGRAEDYLKNIVTREIFAFPINTDSFDKTDERKQLANYFVKFTKEKHEHVGLYIYGPMGIGKTFILKRFAKKLAELGKQVGYVNLPQLVGTIKETFNGKNEQYKKIVETLKNVEYLFVDDIGAEMIASWFRDEILFAILNHRMENKLCTFFTSNYSQTKLITIESSSQYKNAVDNDKSKRLIDRVRTLSEEIPLNGKNRRY